MPNKAPEMDSVPSRTWQEGRTPMLYFAPRIPSSFIESGKKRERDDWRGRLMRVTRQVVLCDGLGQAHWPALVTGLIYDSIIGPLLAYVQGIEVLAAANRLFPPPCCSLLSPACENEDS